MIFADTKCAKGFTFTDTEIKPCFMGDCELGAWYPDGFCGATCVECWEGEYLATDGEYVCDYCGDNFEMME